MATITIELKVGGQVAAVTAMAPKDFTSGSRGYWGQIRPVIDGVKYIASISLVEIGSKNAKPSVEEPIVAFSGAVKATKVARKSAK